MTRALRLAAAAAREAGPPCVRAHVGGVEALVASPRDADAPVVVYANAATPGGVEHPAVARLLRGLAAAGFVGVAPELPRVRDRVVTPESVEALVAVARASGPRTALLGASTGAGLAILAAADDRLAGRLTAVAAVAPFASLRAMLRLATTGWYGDAPYEASSLVAEMAARSLRAGAPADAGVDALLANRDPARFEALFGTLEPETRALVERLSPVGAIPHVAAPVELLVGRVDAFCPPGEARVLARAGRDVRLTVTSGLDHVCPRLRLGALAVARFLERTLRRAAVPDSPAVLRPALAS